MGKISSKKVNAGTRVYYFDLNTDNKGHQYLSITEIPTDMHPGNKKRQRIFVHAERIDGFIEALQETVKIMKDGKKN